MNEVIEQEQIEIEENAETGEEKPEEQQKIKTFAETGIGGLFEDVEQRDLKQVIGKPIVIKDFKELPSQFGGTFCVILARLIDTDKDITFPVGSKILIGKLHALKDSDNIPVETTIIEKESKSGRMYQTFI